MPTNTRWSGQGDWGLSGNAGTARPGIALSNGKQREREKKKKTQLVHICLRWSIKKIRFWLFLKEYMYNII